MERNKKLPGVLDVLVGIPLKGHTPPSSYHDRMILFQHLGYQEAIDELNKKCPRYRFALGCIGEILVPYAREELAKRAVEHDFDYLMMIDDDMLCPPDLFFKLVKHDKDIIAPLAFTRNPNHKPVIYEVIEGYDPITKTDYYTTRFAVNYPRNSIVQCDAVGFGAVLIKRKVLDAMQLPRFMGMQQTGEDITFCYKAKKLGFQVWMDTSVKLGHLSSPIIITEEYSDLFNVLNIEQREKMYGKYQKYESMELV